MSRHKKRVSVGRSDAQTADAAPPPIAASNEPEAPSEPTASEADIAFAETDGMDATDHVAAAAGARAADEVSIDRHPLFWFVLGALTVGIIVLLGLLLLNVRAAAPSPLPTPTQATSVAPARATATRANAAVPAVTLVAPTPTPPDVSAIMTSVAIEHESIARINVTDTKKLLDAGAAILVDVRNEYSYREQHARGAINIPVEATASRLSELPKDKTIIFYCT